MHGSPVAAPGKGEPGDATPAYERATLLHDDFSGHSPALLLTAWADDDTIATTLRHVAPPE